MIRQLLMYALIGLTLAGCHRTNSLSEGTLYHGFTMIDPATREKSANAWMVVNQGKITDLGHDAMPDGLQHSVELNGLFALPGLIDAHAHITAGPHQVKIMDGQPLVTIESDDEITQFHARVALAFGITTVRNPGGDPEANAAYDEKILSREWLGPEALHAGAVVQPPPFGGKAFVYPRSQQAWLEEAKRQADLGMKYFKLYVSLTEDELRQGIEAAHTYGLEAIAHLDDVSWAKAIELGIDGLEHALPTSPDLLVEPARQEFLNTKGPDSKHFYRWFELVDLDSAPIQDLIHQLVRKEIQLNLTLSVNQWTYHTDDLNTVWSTEDQKFGHPESVQAVLGFLRMSAAGWDATDYQRAKATMPKVLEFARRLHQAGVPMMIGTDSNGGGPLLASEAQLHVDAGIPVWGVLNMLTHQAAAMLGISDRIGRFAKEMEADIVFLEQDPLEDIANIKTGHSVLVNGEYSTHEALLPPLQ